MRKIILLAALVGGCNNQSDKQIATDVDIQMLRSRITILDDRVTRLEHRQPSDYAFFSSSTKGWTWLTNGNYAVRVGLGKRAKEGNGSRQSFSFQNPLAVHLRDCTVTLTWGETDKAGTIVEGTKHQHEFELPEGIKSGDYAFPSFDLADIPPDKLGFVTVNSIDCEKTGVPGLGEGSS